MARSLSQTLIRFASLSSSSSSKLDPTRMMTLRYGSNRPEKPEIELDIDRKRAKMERQAMKKLEEAIHKIIVKKSEPDWIPLVPGASYWVPPKSKARGMADVINKLASNPNTVSNSKDQSLAVTSSRGWPSSDYFLKGASQSPLEGETTPKQTSRSEEEEG